MSASARLKNIWGISLGLLSIALPMSLFFPGLLVWLSFAVLIVVGVPHFGITIFYTTEEGVNKFSRTKQGMLLFIIVPLLIMLLIGFFQLYKHQIDTLTFAICIIGIRCFDFFHVVRQYFGIEKLLTRGSPKVLKNNITVATVVIVWLISFVTQLYFPEFSNNVLFIGLGLVVLSIAHSLISDKSLTKNHVYLYLVFLMPIVDIRLYALAIFSHYLEYLYLTNRRWGVFTEKFNNLFSVSFFSLVCLGTCLTLVITGSIFATDQFSLQNPSIEIKDWIMLLVLFDFLFIWHYFSDSLLWKHRYEFNKKGLKRAFN